MRRRFLAWGGVVASMLATAAVGPQDPPEGDTTTDATVSSDELRGHVRFLASDALGGRDTGSPQEALATAYIAERLEAAGWEPAGDAGFLQTVPLVTGAPTEAPELSGTTVDGEAVAYTFGVDFTVYEWAACSGEFELERRDGVEADLTGLAGRAVHVDAGGDARRTLAGRMAELDPRPALALLNGPKSAGRPVGRLPQGRLERGAEAQRRVPMLRARGGLREDLEAGRLASLRVDLHWQPDATLAHNVVARLRGGAEGEQAREAVVLSAHIDHLGTREPAETPAEGEAPDLIYNGADDDASGVAALLEVAEALGLGPRPAREVIVLFATGEERGLLGTFEYLERPAVPLERTVYNLNFEMLGRPDALAGGAGQMWFTGYERTTVGPALAELGIALTPDPRPEEMFFQRSDNIAFVLRDIPGQTLSSYDLHDDYHTPGDEWQTLDYEHMAAAVALAVRATRAIVDGSVPLDWVEGGRLQRR